jgi:anti-sigma28 factor (negative regulator of flagellin synthesis)
MRIQEAYTKLDPQVTTRPNGPATAPTSKVTDTPRTGSAGATHVTLSARAHKLADTARVDALREQVRAGTLKVDVHKIASKLVDGAEDET